MPADIIPLPLPEDEKPAREPSPRDEARYYLQAALGTGVRGALRDTIQAALELATAPRRRELVELQYEALKPGQKLVDPNRPGFLARANRNGVRLIYRHNDPATGKRSEAHIGYLGAISLAEARETWKELRANRMAGAVVAAPSGPAAPTVPTIEELCRRFLDEYSSKVKRSWKTDQRLLEKHVIPEYGDMPADRFTHDVAAQLFASMSDTPREVQKVRACLHTLFNVAVGRTKKLTLAETWLPRDFVNPVTNVQVAAHKPAYYNPSKGEIRSYAAALRAGGIRPDVRDALELQLLCASRIAEVGGMEWSELDLEHGEWRLPAARSKNGDEHLVILSGRARNILERRRSFTEPDTQFVFPIPTHPGQPMRPATAQNLLAKKRKALGVSAAFTTHSVRHAFMSWAGETGYPLEVRNRCTAHKMSGGIDARYNHAELNKPASALWQAWADWLHG